MIFDKSGYIENLQYLEAFFDFSIDVSQHTAGINVPAHILQGNQLFTRLTLTVNSIIHLCPINTLWPSDRQIWDFPSVASLARNLIENYHTFHYIAVDPVSDEERSFRLALLQFHKNYEKYKIYKEFSTVGPDVLKDFEEGLANEREALRSNPFYPTLSKERGKQILKGNEAMFLTQKEVSQRLPFNTDEFSWIYRLFSNQTHSTPMAFTTTNNIRGRGEENEAEVSYMALALYTCLKYVAVAILDMTKLIPTCLQKLDADKLEIVFDRFHHYAT